MRDDPAQHGDHFRITSGDAERFFYHITGTCYCGAVTVTASAPPQAAAYCHCRSCRHWLAAPLTIWGIWPSAAVTFEGKVTTSSTSPESDRVSCTSCGGALANVKPAYNMTVIYASVLGENGTALSPAFHVHYGERVMDISDGLPKYANVPKSFGGDGSFVAEPDATGWRG